MGEENEKSRILVIDDEVRVGGVLKRILSREHQVAVRDRARDGLEALISDEWDLVICDLRLPEMNGPEIYATATSECPELKGRFLFLSGDLSGSDIAAFFDRTGERYLAKPFELAELRKAVSDIIG